MSQGAIITCKEVCVGYGRQEVLHHVNLEIPRGVLVPFVGPNGAGKTTLLRAILGLVQIRSGRITTPFHRCPAGYVPQQKAIDPLYPVTVRRIVQMGIHRRLGWWRRPSAADRQQIQEVLVRFGLADHADKVFGQLSGGMRQKALLARALVSGAEVLILDEPTSELDERSEQEVLVHLQRLCSEQGKTVLLAFHGLGRAATLWDVLCHVNHGKADLVSVGRLCETPSVDLLPAVSQRRPTAPPHTGGSDTWCRSVCGLHRRRASPAARS